MTKRELDLMNLIQLIGLAWEDERELAELERARHQNAVDSSKRMRSTLEYIHGVSGNR